MTKTKTASEFAIRRIVVALDPSMPCRAALEAAVELASALKADLVALLVEDVNLRRLAELPIAKEFRYLFASLEPLDERSLKRGLRVQSQRAKRLMARVADRAQVPYSVREVQGQVTEELLSASIESDLLIVGRASREKTHQVRLGSTALAVAQQARQSVLLLQCGGLTNRPLWVVYDGSESSQRTLMAAAHLSQCGNPVLNVLVLNDEPESFPDLAQAATDYLREREIEANFLFVDKPEVASLVHWLRPHTDCVLLIGAGSLPVNREPLQKLLDELDNPVFLVR